MPNYSKECQPIAGKITALESDVASLQADLQTADPEAKSSLIGMISGKQSDIAHERALLSDCVKKFPYKPPPAPPKNPCLGIKKDVNKLQQDLEDAIDKALAPLQLELQSAASDGKAGLINVINTTRDYVKTHTPFLAEIAAKQKEYDQCVAKHGGLPALAAKFTGTATLQTDNSHFNQPVHRDVTIGLEFSDWDHSHITITSFPEITKEFSLGILGDNTETVTLTSGSGNYDPQSHGISFHLDLDFLGTNSVVGNSSLNIGLMSNDPLPQDGKLTVFGGATFNGGALGGSEGTLTVSGTISPHP